MENSPRRGANVGDAAQGLAVGAAAGLLASALDLTSVFSVWGDRTPWVAGTALLTALAWASPLRRVVLAGTLALALLWCAAAFTPLSRSLAAGLVRSDPPRHADAIYVYASRVQADGDLTSASMSRVLRGIELLSEGYAPRLIVSELPSPQPSYTIPARALLEHLGVKGELLTLGPINSTHDEAVAVARLFKGRGWARVLAVTSPLHSRRAAAALEAQGLEVTSCPSMEPRYDVRRLTGGEDRVMAFSAALHEHLGLWLYRRRGWI